MDIDPDVKMLLFMPRSDNYIKISVNNIGDNQDNYPSEASLTGN